MDADVAAEFRELKQNQQRMVGYDSSRFLVNAKVMQYSGYLLIMLIV